MHLIRSRMSDDYYEIVVARANVPSLNKMVYSEEGLKLQADGKTTFWDDEKKQLILRRKLSSKEKIRIAEESKSRVSMGFKKGDNV